MTPRRLDPKMIVYIHNIVDMRINETISQMDVVVDVSFSKRVENRRRNLYSNGVGVYQSRRELSSRLEDLFGREYGIARSRWKRLVLLTSL